MQRDLYEAEHEAFRRLVRSFVDKEIRPYHREWEAAGIVPRELWQQAGALGLLGLQLPERFGGGGTADFRYNVILTEELVRAGASGVGFGLHNDVVAPYLLALATPEQQERWLPGFCAGTLISAIAMTEPGTGSDLQSVATTARWDGDGYRLNGQKTFITNGINADLVIVAAKTDPTQGARGVSLLVVERGCPGFERGRNLDKIGLKAQDTAELFFADVRVPAANLLGEPGGGFAALMANLPQERLAIAAVAVSAADTVFAHTLAYCKERTAFGRPIGSFQHNRFALAEMATEIELARSYLDRCVREHNSGRLSAADAAMAKWWTTEMTKRLMDQCVQLHGGYGYMADHPVARAYLDNRVQTIYGGTTEIMKEIVGRSLGV